MNSLEHGCWTGVRLIPLPHESTLSALWRFGWQNALTGRAFFEICCGARGFVKEPTSLAIGLNDRFVKETNWNLPCRAEVECLHLSMNVIGPWLDRRLRFCPLCLEAGYHSIWFQFSLLCSCPLHNCILTDRCQSCGAETGYYGATRQLTSRPYGCLSCGGFLSGVEPSLTVHMDFRLHAKQLEHAFSGFLQWILESRRYLLPLQHIHQKKAWVAAGKGLRWCNPNELLRHTALKLHPFPDKTKATAGASVSLIRWRVSMQTKILQAHAKPSWRRRVQTPTAVYCATIRKLQNWLFGGSSIQIREIGLRSKWNKAIDENKIDVMLWDSYELAYVLMRNSQAPVIDLGMEMSELTLKDMPSFGLSTYEERVPRAAYRAVFLAIFAGYFYWMNRARRFGAKLNLLDVISVSPAHLIAVFNVPDARQSVISGGVFFPTVPGMPIPPLALSSTCQLKRTG